MKKAMLLVLALSVVMTSSVAFGQAGAIVLYADIAYTSCNALYLSGVQTVYVRHELSPGTTASQFMLTNNPGMIYLADQAPTGSGFLLLGSSQTGIAISYNSCLGDAIPILNVLYSAAAPAVCSTIEVVPDPAALTGQIEGVDCAQNSTFPNGSIMTFNSDGTCACGIVVPVEETNWGRVKSLYSN